MKFSVTALLLLSAATWGVSATAAISATPTNTLSWSAVLPSNQKLYRYAPSTMEANGQRYMYYCANVAGRTYTGGTAAVEGSNGTYSQGGTLANNDPIYDFIVMRVGTQVSGKWSYGPERVVLDPGANQDDIWDRRHICDPEVIAGEFRYRQPGQTSQEVYNYAMFYTGAGFQGDDYKHRGLKEPINHVGWAVSKTPTGPWYKVVGYNALVKASKDEGGWGVGQPSVTSINGKGKVLLFYTRGTASLTSVKAVELDLSNANLPLDKYGNSPFNSNFIKGSEFYIPTTGLKAYNGHAAHLLLNPAFMYDPSSDEFIMAAPVLDKRGDTAWCTKGQQDSLGDVSAQVQVARMKGSSLWSGGGSWTMMGILSGGSINTSGTLEDNDAYGVMAPNSIRYFDPGLIRSSLGYKLLGSLHFHSSVTPHNIVEGGVVKAERCRTLYNYRIEEFAVQ